MQSRVSTGYHVHQIDNMTLPGHNVMHTLIAWTVGRERVPDAGDAFLAVTGASKIKVFDRDGTERGESLQGDMYIRDQKNTKGHVSPCTYGHWHPTDRYVRPSCALAPLRLSLFTE